MALKDNASLALIPAAYKTSKVYSAIPTDGDGDFTFSRTGNATRVNKAGLIETMASNEPRLDYPLVNGVVQSCPTLLLEPLRRNLFTDSDLSSTSAFTNGDATETTTSLINGLTGKKIEVTSSGRAFFTISASVVIGTDYTISCYVDEYTGQEISNFIDITAGGGSEDFSSDLITNGRMQGTFTATSTSVNIRIGIGTTNTISNAVSAKISGVQLEDSGSGNDATYATSLIQTSGSITTRNAETCNGAGDSSTFNDNEGVLFAEIAALANDGTSRRLSISDSSNNNQVSIIYGSSNSISPTIYSGGSFQMGGSHTLTDQTDTIKVALKYSTNDAALWVNGTEVLTDTSVTTPTGLNQARFEYGGGSNDFYGKCKQLIVFKTALSDSELEELTS